MNDHFKRNVSKFDNFSRYKKVVDRQTNKHFRKENNCAGCTIVELVQYYHSYFYKYYSCYYSQIKYSNYHQYYYDVCIISFTGALAFTLFSDPSIYLPNQQFIHPTFSVHSPQTTQI